jgi:hypothetical protein
MHALMAVEHHATYVSAFGDAQFSIAVSASQRRCELGAVFVGRDVIIINPRSPHHNHPSQ